MFSYWTKILIQAEQKAFLLDGAVVKKLNFMVSPVGGACSLRTPYSHLDGQSPKRNKPHRWGQSPSMRYIEYFSDCLSSIGKEIGHLA
jgi:hypothetical protein